MSDLIGRLESAGGPDLDLDRAIATEVYDIEWRPYGPRARKLWGFLRGTDAVKFYGRVPNYTESIDEALILVPEGKYWLVGSGRTRADEPLGGASIVDPATLKNIAEAEHERPAIALCIAALKARAALSPPKRD